MKRGIYNCARGTRDCGRTLRSKDLNGSECKESKKSLDCQSRARENFWCECKDVVRDQDVIGKEALLASSPAARSEPEL